MKKPHGNTGNNHAAKPEPRKKRSFYATDTEWQRYAELAAAAGMERGEWIRHQCERSEHINQLLQEAYDKGAADEYKAMKAMENEQ